MSHARIVILIGFSTVMGCGNPNNGAPPDLQRAIDLALPDQAQSVQPDSSVLDDLTMSAGGDLATGGFCSGTAADGTCAQAFFSPVSQCFVATGACMSEMGDMMMNSDWCWAGGGHFNGTYPNGMPHAVWSNAQNTLCMTGDLISMQGPTLKLVAFGQTLVVRLDNGAVTCPDGSMINIGGNPCMAITDLINPPMSQCTAGQCP